MDSMYLSKDKLDGFGNVRYLPRSTRSDSGIRLESTNHTIGESIKIA